MKKFLFLLFVIITSNLVFGQVGSVYSDFGLGELNLNSSTRRSGMGLAVAGNDNFDINSFNPASNSKIKFVKFVGSFGYGINSYKDNYSSNYFRSGSFNQLLIAIPIQRDYGIVFTGGITPLTKVNYKISAPELVFDSTKYTVNYESLGGLYNYFAGLTYQLKDYASLGISTNFLVGSVSKALSTEFDDPSVTNPRFSKLSKYRGVAIKIGTVSEDLNKYFKFSSIKDLKIGLTYQFSKNLKTDYSELKQGIFIDTVSETTFDTEFPSQFAIGISSKLNERLTLYVDFLNQDWSKLNTNSSSHFTGKSQNYFSLGFEYVPALRPERYLDAISWRFGLFLNDLGFTINNEKINEYGVRAGVSLPIDQLNMIEFGVQYSTRGKLKSNLVKESILNFWFGINLAEIWFVRNEE